MTPPNPEKPFWEATCHNCNSTERFDTYKDARFFSDSHEEFNDQHLVTINFYLEEEDVSK